jgi:phospholipid/cholesterol/gamma-HCH transport system ATP-binding protein
MNAVTAAGAMAPVIGLSELSFELGAGELMIVEPERHVETVSLFDVAAGLMGPETGVVQFCGQDWQRMGLFAQSAARGRIGRIFAVEGWVSNLSVFENIALSQRHHTTRSDRELQREAAALLERIGMSDCLAERPHVLSHGELRRAQWVRAFMGEPALLLLNAPLLDVRPDDQAPLLELLCEARARGVAAMWKSRDAASWSGEEAGSDVTRVRFSGGKLLKQDSDDGPVGECRQREMKR